MMEAIDWPLDQLQLGMRSDGPLGTITELKASRLQKLLAITCYCRGNYGQLCISSGKFSTGSPGNS